MFKLCLAYLLISLLVNTPQSEAEEFNILTHELPPFNFRENGKYIGINTEIIEKVLKQENIPYKIEAINWARAQKMVQQLPNTALLSAGRSQERENKYAWIGPLVTSPAYLFKLSSRSDVQVDSNEDLKHFLIGTTRRNVMADYFINLGLKEPDNLLFVAKASDNYRALFKSRVDLVIGSELTTPYTVRDLGFNYSAVESTIEIKMNEMLSYLAVNKTFSPELISRCNARIKSMWENGEIDAIVDSYRLQAKKE